MANLIIEHADGRRYGTTTEGFERLRDTDYEGFTVVGEETPADFDVDVPAPRKGRARKKAAAPITKPRAKNLRVTPAITHETTVTNGGSDE